MAYWGIETNQNKGLWVLFFCSLVAGAVMLPLGWTNVGSCVDEYNKCQRSYSSSKYCEEQRNDCARQWASVWLAGVILLIAASVPQCVFCCCSQPPPAVASSVPTANAVVPSTQEAVFVQQPGLQSPYPPAPGTMVASASAVPVTGQPVMYAAGVPAVQPSQAGGQPVVYNAVAPPKGPPPPPPV